METLSLPILGSMKGITLRTMCVTLVLVVGFGTAVFAGGHASPEEARAMLLKAVAYYKAVGRKQALADFTVSKPPFRDRDLYVFCLGPDRTIVANGGFPDTVGAPEDALVSADGKGVGSMARQLIAANGESAVRYRWINPLTHSLESKITFFARVGDDVCAVGAYLPH
jgi:cytochrome c